MPSTSLPDDEARALGAKLRALLDRQGITVMEASARTGWSRAALYAAFTGKSTPGVVMIRDLLRLTDGRWADLD